MIVQIGAYSYQTSGGTTLLVYYPMTKNIFYIGTHTGVISGASIVVEEFNDYFSLVSRVQSLNLNFTREDAKVIRDRLEYAEITLPPQILEAMDAYVLYKNGPEAVENASLSEPPPIELPTPSPGGI